MEDSYLKVNELRLKKTHTNCYLANNNIASFKIPSLFDKQDSTPWLYEKLNVSIYEVI